MLSEQDLLQYLKYHLAPWKGMLNSWKKIARSRPSEDLSTGWLGPGENCSRAS